MFQKKDTSPFAEEREEAFKLGEKAAVVAYLDFAEVT